MSLCFRYNSISALRENDLLGLEKLELLMLHSNMIMNIEDNTFQDLKSLQVKPFFPLGLWTELFDILDFSFCDRLL